jgi:hypothetical protein
LDGDVANAAKSIRKDFRDRVPDLAIVEENGGDGVFYYSPLRDPRAFDSDFFGYSPEIRGRGA